MDQDFKDRQRSRENVLGIALAVLVGGIALFFLYFVSFGVVGNVMMGGGLIVVIGVLHYLFWGRALSDEVAAEREALAKKESREPRRRKAPPDAIQDLSRTQGIQE
jgi:predicted tellurium resistance membrane protein TerC